MFKNKSINSMLCLSEHYISVKVSVFLTIFSNNHHNEQVIASEDNLLIHMILQVFSHSREGIKMYETRRDLIQFS